MCPCVAGGAAAESGIQRQNDEGQGKPAELCLLNPTWQHHRSHACRCLNATATTSSATTTLATASHWHWHYYCHCHWHWHWHWHCHTTGTTTGTTTGPTASHCHYPLARHLPPPSLHYCQYITTLSAGICVLKGPQGCGVTATAPHPRGSVLWTEHPMLVTSTETFRAQWRAYITVRAAWLHGLVVRLPVLLCCLLCRHTSQWVLPGYLVGCVALLLAL